MTARCTRLSSRDGMMCGLAAQHSRHLLCVGSFSACPRSFQAKADVPCSVVVFSPAGGAALSRSKDGKPPPLPAVHD